MSTPESEQIQHGLTPNAVPPEGREVGDASISVGLLASIVESSFDAIITKDLTGTVTSWNAGAERIFGYAAEEMIGRPITTLIPERFRADEDRILQTIRVGETVEPFDTVRLKKGGEEIEVSLTVSPIRDGAGQIVGASKVARNLTEWRRAEARLREKERQLHVSDRRLAEIVHSMQEGFYAIDFDWRITFVNDRIASAFGFEDEPLVGRTFWEAFPRLVGTRSEACHRQVMLERTPLTYEYFSSLGSGWLEVRLFPTEEGLAACVLDVHERKMAEEAILKLNSDLEARVLERTEELEWVNNELESFTSTVSHDLRTPLRTIDGHSQMILEDFGELLPEEAVQSINSIRRGAAKMRTLIDDLLTFSRMGRAPIDKTPINVAKLVESVYRDLSANEKGRRIELRIGELPDCEGDLSLLRQVWDNLLSNALKYTRYIDVPIVEVGCNRGPEENVYFVRDNGAGFDMAHAHRLFGAFERLHRWDEFEGNGIGLATVQRVVHRHGGRVWAESAVNQGATFYFTVGHRSSTVGPT